MIIEICLPNVLPTIPFDLQEVFRVQRDFVGALFGVQTTHDEVRVNLVFECLYLRFVW